MPFAAFLGVAVETATPIYFLEHWKIGLAQKDKMS
jgi:hypothetical protein